MKKVLSTYMMIHLILGCTSVKIHKPQKNYAHLPDICQKNIKRISEIFFYNRKKHHYVLSGNAISDLCNAHPIRGANPPKAIQCCNLFSHAEIRDIFGKPSMETHQGFYYYLDDKIYPNNTHYSLLFFKDSLRRISRIHIGLCPTD